MTDPSATEGDRQPVDLALDLLFYAPLGLAFTATEELPKLAEKGRQRWMTAKVVGRFAVDEGRKRVTARFSSPPPTAAPAQPPAPEPARTRPARPPTPLPRQAASEPAPDPATPLPVVDELAIPGYDSLSASQVVQRLGGLAPAELDAVRRYEAGTRSRRTILARVAQLQGP